MELKHKNSLNQRPLKPIKGTRLYTRVIPNKPSENLGDLFLKYMGKVYYAEAVFSSAPTIEYRF